MELTTPIIHKNGTSAEDLLINYREALDALRLAEEQLLKTHPNGRDYYCHPEPGALSSAIKQHVARLGRIRQTMHEISDLACHCSDHV